MQAPRPNVAIVIRSLVFNVLFYALMILCQIALIPTLVMPRRAIVAGATWFGRANLWLLRHVCGIHAEIRGREKIPNGALLVAAKHQSVWETFTLLALFDDPAFIMKRDLFWIPVFGWLAWKGGMLPVVRARGSKALADLTPRVQRALADGHQVLIFPEGTRRAVHAPPDYKYGIAHLYAETAMRCLPIALNSGVFWPRRSFLRYPGTIVAQVLDPLRPGLPPADFRTLLQGMIEPATERLVAEGEAERDALMRAG